MRLLTLLAALMVFSTLPALADDLGEKAGAAPDVGKVMPVAKQEARTAVTETSGHENIAPEAGYDASGEHSAQWGYTGEVAAHNWDKLDPAYKTCGAGTKQSPINIQAFLQDPDLPMLNTVYQPTSLNVSNDGHTLKVDYAQGSKMVVGDTIYELSQIQFRTPSEHYMDGAPYPMEMQLVHKSEGGAVGVLSVPIKVGLANPTIQAVWQNAPLSEGHKNISGVEISAADLLPTAPESGYSYYHYEGSLTTPPCTEGVQWHVLKDPIEVSAGQLVAFQTLFPVNARLIQPLHGRIVKGN